MTQGQREIELRRCPRCGAPMRKPPGSSLYWHSDNNHPRCDITNIVEASFVAQPGNDPRGEAPKSSSRKKE